MARLSRADRLSFFIHPAHLQHLDGPEGEHGGRDASRWHFSPRHPCFRANAHDRRKVWLRSFAIYPYCSPRNPGARIGMNQFLNPDSILRAKNRLEQPLGLVRQDNLGTGPDASTGGEKPELASLVDEANLDSPGPLADRCGIQSRGILSTARPTTPPSHHMLCSVLPPTVNR